jgi:hypothetical protein
VDKCKFWMKGDGIVTPPLFLRGATRKFLTFLVAAIFSIAGSVNLFGRPRTSSGLNLAATRCLQQF